MSPGCATAAIRRHLEPTVFFREQEAFDITRQGLAAVLACAPFGDFIEPRNEPGANLHGPP